ncbi:serine hydrolase domain-containing protein [Gramella sp. KN1008]|uniref:serine hydrolase domain-containing protein n=1 Tax=Gramella sp. KN1008 TaxID=2529298 RepID=UPI00103B5110|nr:serine hydrolase domain-containing protein [Gramella sp. KN1008]TBW26559.1 serine hydrolase [Gramella sp. KN1008]
MKIKLLLFTLSLFSIISVAQNSVSSKISEYLENTQKVHGIPGMAAAVIKNDNILYQDYFGTGMIESLTPVSKNSMMPLFSASKLMTNVAVFKLVEEEKINITDPISKYFKDIPEEWKKVTIQNLLTHSSGIPDFIRFDMSLPHDKLLKELYKEEMYFEPGAHFQYNQTNYWFLARIIEQITGDKFADYIIRNQFNGNSEGILYSSNFKEAIPNRVIKYNYIAKRELFERNTPVGDEIGHPGNGISITMPRLIEWCQNVLKNKFLSSETHKLMLETFEYEKGPKEHFTNGWAVYKVNGNLTYGFTGGGVSGIRFFPEKDMAIIFLSNGMKTYSVHNMVINHLAGMIDKDLADENELMMNKIEEEFIEGNISAEGVFQNYKKLFAEDTEAHLNALGYKFIDNNPKYAVRLFETMVNEFPNSFNAYDSLGEAYMKIGNNKKAKTNFQKSLDLNPENKNAEDMISRLKT